MRKKKTAIYLEDVVEALKKLTAEEESYVDPFESVFLMLKDLPPSAQPQLEECPIYGGMCGYPSNLCYECPRHGGAHEKPLWWTAGLQPSAQPRWIPVTEEVFPDEDNCTGRGIQYSEPVLATIVNHGSDDEMFVDMVCTADGEWKLVHPTDGDNDIPSWCEVIAWCELPEPWKGEER